jgi:hypothetical protein
MIRIADEGETNSGQARVDSKRWMRLFIRHRGDFIVQHRKSASDALAKTKCS